jgi:hypothetical protein
VTCWVRRHARGGKVKKVAVELAVLNADVQTMMMIVVMVMMMTRVIAGVEIEV